MKFLDCIQISPPVSLVKGKIYSFIEMANVSTVFREPDSIDVKAFSSGTKFEDGDTVIARIEPCLQNGKRFFVKGIGKGFGSTEFLVFRPKTIDVDNKYLYYFMKTEYIQQLMVSSMTGATGRQRVNNDIFSDLEISLPDLPTQRRIASILSAYDDLIENNRRQIKLLEEAAQRLYREWFVELRFPGHESVKVVDGVPEGWMKVCLKDICETKTGKKDANFGCDDGAYPFFTCAQAPIKAPSYSFDCSAVILAGNGDFNVKLYRGKFEAYQRTYVLSPANTEYLFLLYNAVRRNMNVLTKGASGSTIKFLTKGMIDSIDLLIPSSQLLTTYNQNSEALQKSIEVLRRKIALAVEARDRLLPRLMNHEMEVML